jgi:hypothetical protein
MGESSVRDAEGGIGTGVLSLFVGLPAALLFNSFVQGQDTAVFLLVLVGFGGCILYGEIIVAMPNGVAFGTGLVLAGFLSQSGWAVGLGVAAAAVSLARYALAKPDAGEFDADSEVA